MTPAPGRNRWGRRAAYSTVLMLLAGALVAGGCGDGRAAAPTTATPTFPGSTRPSTTPALPVTTGTVSTVPVTTGTVSTVPVTTGPVTTVPVTSAVVPVTTPPVRVNIGFLGPDAPAGPDATLGRSVENGERLAVSQFTSDNPGLIVTIDTAPQDATRAAQRLVRDGVVAVIGPQLPTEARLALPVLTAAGIPAVTATATAADLAQSGWSFFCVVADDRQQGIDAAAELVTSLHVTSLAVLAGDTAGALTRTSWVSSTATQLGATVADEPAAPVTAATVGGAAQQAIGSGVAGVYFSGPGALAQVLVSDLVAGGYQGVVLLASDATSSELGPLGSTADGVYVASAADDPAAIAAHGGNGLVFDDAYRAAFGSEAPLWAAEAYDATNIVLQAVASGATTGPTVSAYLFNHMWTGVSGLLSFDSSGDRVDPAIFVSRIEDGVPVQIGSATAASG